MPTSAGFKSLYPGQGWLDTNLPEATKQMCKDEIESGAFDLDAKLCQVWSEGMQITLKFDRGDSSVYQATMTCVDPESPSYGIWLSMRAKEAHQALGRVLWFYLVYLEGDLENGKLSKPRDIW